jgi:hypothetical protein
MANLLVHRSQRPLALLLQEAVSSSTTTLLVHDSEVLLALLLKGNILLLEKRKKISCQQSVSYYVPNEAVHTDATYD